MGNENLALWYDESIDDVVVATECPKERGSGYRMINTRDLTLDTEKDETRPSSALIVEALREKIQQVSSNMKTTESDKRSLEQLIEFLRETGYSMVERYWEIDERELREADKQLCSEMDQLERDIKNTRAPGDEAAHQHRLQDLQTLQSRAAISNIAVHRLRGFQASQQTSWSDILSMTAQLISKADRDTPSVVEILREDEDLIREKNSALRRSLQENEEKYKERYKGKRWDVLNTVPLETLVTEAKIPVSSSKQVKSSISKLGKETNNASPWHATGQGSTAQDLVTSQDAALALIDQLASSPWKESALRYVTDKSHSVWRSATNSQNDDLWRACRDRLSRMLTLPISPFGLSVNDNPTESKDREENLSKQHAATSTDSHAVDAKSGSLLQSIRQYWPLTAGAPPVGTGVHEPDTASAGLTVAASSSNVPTSRDEAGVIAGNPSLPQPADQVNSVEGGRNRRSVAKEAPTVLDAELASNMMDATTRETTNLETAPAQRDARITALRSLTTLTNANSDSAATDPNRPLPSHTQTPPIVASDSFSGDATAKMWPTPTSGALILQPDYDGEDMGETRHQRILEPVPSSVPPTMVAEHIRSIRPHATASSSELQLSAIQTVEIPPGDSPVRLEEVTQLSLPLPSSRPQCSTVVTDDVHTDHIFASTGADGIDVDYFTPFVESNDASCSRSTEGVHGLSHSGQLDVAGTEKDNETSDPVQPSHGQVEAGSQSQTFGPDTLVVYLLRGSEDSLQQTPRAQRRNSAEALFGKGVLHTDYNSLTDVIASKGLASKPTEFANKADMDGPLSMKSCLDAWREDGHDEMEAGGPVIRRNREDWDVIYN